MACCPEYGDCAAERFQCHARFDGRLTIVISMLIEAVSAETSRGGRSPRVRGA